MAGSKEFGRSLSSAGTSVYRYLDVSTQHVPYDELGQLSEMAGALKQDPDYPRAIEHKYGFIVHVPSDPETREEEIARVEDKLPGLARVLRLAVKENCLLVYIDTDGAIIEELPLREEAFVVLGGHAVMPQRARRR